MCWWWKNISREYRVAFSTIFASTCNPLAGEGGGDKPQAQRPSTVAVAMSIRRFSRR